MPPEALEPAAATTIAASVVVGMGEARVVKQGTGPQTALVAYGLGSCIALCLWDPAAHVAGMAHVVLPGADPTGAPNPRYARSALPALFARMRAAGAAPDPTRYIARLAGGAQVLALGGPGGLPRVGDQNARAVRAALADAGVALAACEVGGGMGRSVWFDPCDAGRIRVRAIGQLEHYV